MLEAVRVRPVGWLITASASESVAIHPSRCIGVAARVAASAWRPVRGRPRATPSPYAAASPWLRTASSSRNTGETVAAATGASLDKELMAVLGTSH